MDHNLRSLASGDGSATLDGIEEMLLGSANRDGNPKCRQHLKSAADEPYVGGPK